MYGETTVHIGNSTVQVQDNLSIHWAVKLPKHVNQHCARMIWKLRVSAAFLFKDTCGTSNWSVNIHYTATPCSHEHWQLHVQLGNQSIPLNHNLLAPELNLKQLDQLVHQEMKTHHPRLSQGWINRLKIRRVETLWSKADQLVIIEMYLDANQSPLHSLQRWV